MEEDFRSGAGRRAHEPTSSASGPTRSRSGIITVTARSALKFVGALEIMLGGVPQTFSLLLLCVNLRPVSI